MENTDEKNERRTIGFHPCVGKKASGEERPTTVVIRAANGKYVAYEFVEQQLLDFFTCGAVVAWRDAVAGDTPVHRAPHHYRWVKTDEQMYAANAPSDPIQGDAGSRKLFRVLTKKSTGEITDYERLQIPAEFVALQPATDIVGVANGGMGFQIMEVLLGRYPDMDMRVIGSGTLKEWRPKLDELLPTALRRKAEKVRAAAAVAEKSPTATVVVADGAKPPEVVADGETDDEEEEELSKSAAKDANAKFDAHRIAYALADEAASKLFHRCTMRDRDWAAVNIAYGRLETARKARVAAEQQFRQIHRAELRRLVKNPLVPYVTLGAGDEDDQRIEALLATYETTLRICVTGEKEVAKKMELLRRSFVRIEGARVVEEEMEQHLERALDALPEYTEFLPAAKAMVDPTTGLPLGKFLGPRIFGRLIAGLGSPMSSRINEPMRQGDVDRIAACKQALTEAIAKLDRIGLPEQPPSGDGQTREWLLACERVVAGRIAMGASIDYQLAQITTCRDAYRALMNALKCAKNRSRNRVIAYMGLHVRQGGKYAGTPKGLEFPRRRKGCRANWNEQLLRQASVQWTALIIKGGDSYWKVHVYAPMKQRMLANGHGKMAAHRDACWRTSTVSMRWFIDLWFQWERNRATAEAAKEAA